MGDESSTETALFRLVLREFFRSMVDGDLGRVKTEGS
jgi:hypothetical protein